MTKDANAGEPNDAWRQRLVGPVVHATLRQIELLAAKWVMHGVAHGHTYGRLPGEEEIRAWSIPASTGYHLHSLARVLRSATVLEIGCSFGYSTLWLASAVQGFGGKVHSCEIFKPKADLARQHFERSGLRNIELIEAEALETTRHWNKPIDLLFLDADPENYPRYWANLQPWLHANTLVVMDNAANHREVTQPFMDLVAGDVGWNSWTVPLDHGLFFTQRTRA